MTVLSRSSFLALALLAAGCGPKPPSIAGWWSVDAKAPMVRAGFKPLAGLEGEFRLKDDGTYDSDGFVGKGRWREVGDRVVLTPDAGRVPAQLFQAGGRRLSTFPPPTFRHEHGELRLYAAGREKEGWGIRFVPYSPTPDEAAKGSKKAPDFSYLGSPEWRLRRSFWGAIEEGNVGKVRECLGRGADVEGPEAAMREYYLFGYTPLALAAWRHRDLVAAELLRAGARPDARAESGKTPLMVAAAGDDLPTARVLLRFKADRSLRSPQGKTAADYAREKGYADVLAILK